MKQAKLIGSVQRAIDIMFAKAPGFAPAWQITLKEAEEEMLNAERGIIPFFKRMTGSTSKGHEDYETERRKALEMQRVRLEAGEKPDFGDSLMAWDTRTGQLGIFGFVLLVLEMLWGRATLVIFAVSFDGMPDLKGSLLALLEPENLGFIVTWVAVGGVFATLIFAVSVVAIPMILHRQTDAITAGLTSLRLVLAQPGVMLWWAALIAGIVGLALLPWFAGLLLAGPVIGHASWHAYRAAVAD